MLKHYLIRLVHRPPDSYCQTTIIEPFANIYENIVGLLKKRPENICLKFILKVITIIMRRF